MGRCEPPGFLAKEAHNGPPEPESFFGEEEKRLKHHPKKRKEFGKALDNMMDSFGSSHEGHYGNDLVDFVKEIPYLPRDMYEIARGVSGGTSYVDDGVPHHTNILPISNKGFAANCTDCHYKSDIMATPTAASLLGDHHQDTMKLGHPPTKQDYRNMVADEDARRAKQKIKNDEYDKAAGLSFLKQIYRG